MRSNTTIFEYDGRGRPIRSTDALGHQTIFEYDNAGNVTLIRDANGNATRFRYDARSRLIETINPAGGVIVSEYDLDNNPTSLTDPAGNTTSFAYDARNRVTRRTDANGHDDLFTYDVVDNLISRTDRNGRITEFAFDDLNRLVTETWVGDGNVIQYEYDAAGNLLFASDDFSSLSFTYDNRNRQRTVDNSGTPGLPSVVLTYQYDSVGNVTSLADSIGGNAGGTNSYQYDPLNRLTQLTQTGTNVSDKRVDFSYDPIGQLESIERFSDLGGTQSVVMSTFVYDTLNRLESLSHDKNSSNVAFFDLQYDAASRIIEISSVDDTASYSYDRRDQLVSAKRDIPGNLDESYAYDANGNPTQSHQHGDDYQTGPGNRLESDGLFNYAYDDVGNQIERTEIATGSVRQFTWDYRNRLVAVVDKDASGTEIQRVEFSYDSLNRRISKSVAAADTVLTHFVYDFDDVLLEFVDEDGAAGPSGSELARRYLHGIAVDQVLAQDDGAGNVQWHLTDHLGTVTDLVDNTGSVVNHIEYDSRGNILRQSDAAVTTRYLFTGREYDAETNLYYFRRRYFDSTVGRFLSEDPAGLVADVNNYRYAWNDPVRSTDPSGLQSVSFVGSGPFSTSLINQGINQGVHFFADRDPSVQGFRQGEVDAFDRGRIDPRFRDQIERIREDLKNRPKRDFEIDIEQQGCMVIVTVKRKRDGVTEIEQFTFNTNSPNFNLQSAIDSVLGTLGN